MADPTDPGDQQPGDTAGQGLGSRFDDAAESPGLVLWQVTNQWQARMRAALRPHRLTHVQYVLLASLTWIAGHRTDPDITQVELAAHASTDPMMTSQVTRVLADRGLLERRPHPTDGRARLVRVTAEGAALARAATADVEAADDRFFTVLDDADDFTRQLSRLARAHSGAR